VCHDFLDVYGNQFQPFLGDKQYISDPFWNRVLPKEDEIKEIREQEKADQKMSIGIEDNYTQKKNAAKNKKLEVVSLIKDSFQVQKLIVQLLKSAQEDIALAVPTTATDIFFSSKAQETTSYASSSFSYSVFFKLIKDLAVDNKKLNVGMVTNAKRQKRESEQDTRDILSDFRQNEDLSNIHVKYIEQDYSSLNENMVILVVDRSVSLAIELEEKDEKQQEERGELEYKRGSSYRMIKLATYSNNKSTVLSYISIFESLWKEIELNEKITGLLDEIKRRENIERDFISMAAHELRAPIQPVLGLTQILQSKRNVDTKEQEELLSVIIRNARRLNILTENLLDLAKIESKTLNLQKETFSLSEIIFDAISDMKSQLSFHQVAVNIEYNDGSAKDIQEDIINDISGKIVDQGGDAFVVKADKTRVMQVISNLLVNAIKFTEKGKIVIGLHNTNTASQKEEGEQAGERR
jgi:signal transduction histidine kinase